MSPDRILEIVSGKHGLTADAALPPERHCQHPAGDVVALQTDADLTVTECTVGAKVKKRIHPLVVRGNTDERPEKLP